MSVYKRERIRRIMFGRKPKDKYQLKVIAVIAFMVMVIVNSLATLLPINGQTTAEVSDKYGSLFAPAGITFAIWGVIYLLLGGFIYYQFAKVRSRNSKVREEVVAKILPYAIASFVINFLWILAWHYDLIGLSVALMVGLLVVLLKVMGIVTAEKYSGVDFMWMQLPFSVYVGWITVALIANVTAFLVSVGWSGLGISDVAWTNIILIVGGVIGLAATYRFRSLSYLAVIIWAYSGILIKHFTIFSANYPAIIIVTAITIAVLISTLTSVLAYRKITA